MHKLVSPVNKKIVPSKLTFDNDIQISTKKERTKNTCTITNDSLSASSKIHVARKPCKNVMRIVHLSFFLVTLYDKTLQKT